MTITRPIFGEEGDDELDGGSGQDRVVGDELRPGPGPASSAVVDGRRRLRFSIGQVGRPGRAELSERFESRVTERCVT